MTADHPLWMMNAVSTTATNSGVVKTSAIIAVVPALATRCQAGEELTRSLSQKNNANTVKLSAKL
jgi:hypothetical protein